MKRFLKSKMIWLGLVADMLGVAYLHAEELRATIPPEYYGYILIALGISIKMLRAVTTVPLSEK